MDGNRFDALTRRLTSRRTALRAGGLGLVATVASWGCSSAREAIPAAEPDTGASTGFPEFLFVQAFDHGTWLPKPGEDDTYLLTLQGVAAQTIFFSDRPDRIVGQAPTERFLDALGFTPANPPNAAIVAERAIRRDTQEVLVIELMNPTYDLDEGRITYEARVLADYGEHGLEHIIGQRQDYELAEIFGTGSMFIDDCSDGHSKCALKSDGTIIGRMNHIGCCWSWNELECRVCDHDGDSGYYGQLCAEAFPEDCSPVNGEYPCRSKDRVCHGGDPPPQ